MLAKYRVFHLEHPAEDKPVNHAQTGPKLQLRHKKLMLTTKPALVSQIIVVTV